MTEHTHPLRAGQRHRGRLTLVFALVAVFMVVELVAAWLSGSLALISDAGHMATDALGLGMALAAIVVADRIRSSGGKTYGWYRLEILAALANAGLLFLVSGYVIYEAIRRIGDPPQVDTTPMIVVAAVGLVINIVGWRLLRSGAEESLNVKGAYFEVIADLTASIGTIVAALVMIFFA
jgi:cobalt-zinc-cadmium efflux system protein